MGLEVAIVGLDDTIVGLEVAIVGLEDTIAGLELTIVGLEDMIVGLEATIVGLENMIVGLEDTIVGLENTIVGLEDTIVGLESMIVGLESNFSVICKSWHLARVLYITLLAWSAGLLQSHTLSIYMSATNMHAQKIVLRSRVVSVLIGATTSTLSCRLAVVAPALAAACGLKSSRRWGESFTSTYWPPTQLAMSKPRSRSTNPIAPLISNSWSTEAKSWRTTAS